MASIRIDNIPFPGTDLFNDQETFLNEVYEDNLTEVYGGISPTITVSIAVTGAAVFSYNVGKMTVEIYDAWQRRRGG